MRISDWSSDVCSSDLNAPWNHGRRGSALREPFAAFVCDDETAEGIRPILNEIEIGRASCRERVCQYVYISVVAVSLKKKKHLVRWSCHSFFTTNIYMLPP